MAYEEDKQGGFKLKLRADLASGAWLDTFDERTPVWESLVNCRSDGVGIEKTYGAELITAITVEASSPGPIRGLLAYQTGVERFLVYGDLTTLYRYDEADSAITVVGDGFTGSSTGGGSVWDGGATQWDGGDTTWDEGAVQATLWSMVQFQDAVLATNGVNPPQISFGEGHFASLYDGVVQLTITNSGSDYEVGDTLSATGGGGSGFSGEVASVDGLGAITAVRILDGGSLYTSEPTITVTTTAGTGATIVATIGQLQQLETETISIFANRGPHVLGFRTNQDLKEFIWCSAGDPTDWIPTQENSAGFQTIHELDTPVTAALPLGEQIVVYGQDQAFAVSYVGQPFYFTYRPIMNGVGAVSKASVTSIGRQHVGLSWRGFFVTDGVSFEYVDVPAVHDFFREAVESGTLGTVVAYHNALDSEVHFTYQLDTTTYAELVYNYKTQQWHQTTNGPSYGVPRTVFPTPVVGMPDGRVLFYGDALNFDGQAIQATATTKAMAIGNVDRIKEIDQLRIGFTGNGNGLQVRLGWSERQDDAPMFGGGITINPGYPEIFTRVAGRWLTLEISSNSLNSEWRVESVDVIGRMEGSR